MKVTRILMLLITVTVAKHHHNSLRKNVLKLKSNGYFFKTLNKDIHIVMENIFDCLNLVIDFTKKPNIKLLLTMYYDLSNISDKNYDVFDEIQNVTKINFLNQTENIIRLNNAVEEILTNNHFNAYHQLRGKKRKHVRLRTKTRKRSKKVHFSSDFGDSDEFMDFIIDFLEKINNLSIKDFKQSSKLKRRPVSSRKNLKVWEPPLNMTGIDTLNGTHSRRVFRGQETQVKNFPFIVSIHIMGEFGCSGSIISRDLIITAASCLDVAYRNDFFIRNPRSIYVRLGSDYTMRHGETVPIQELHFHPSYRSQTMRHNLAIVRLEKRIRFTRQQQKIRRVLWDRTPERLKEDTNEVIILGWGATTSNQRVNPHQKLTVDTLDLYPFRECRDIYSRKFVAEEHFCAGFTKISGGACNGDIGGPGIVGATLVGIISFGAPVCGIIDAPTVFTKLGYYTPWIEGIMGPQVKRRDKMKYSRRFQKSKDYYKPPYFNMASLYANSRPQFRTEDYPEEVKVLREILLELVQSDSAVVDELLYGELYDDFNDLFASSETVNHMQHPLVNKSLYARPNIHYQKNKTYSTVRLTVSSGVTPFSPPRKTVSSPHYHTTHAVVTTNKVHISDIMRKPPWSHEGDNFYSNNYEESSESSGMSIEILTSVLPKPSHESKDTLSNENLSEDSLEVKSNSKKEELSSEEDSLKETSSEETGEGSHKNIAESVELSDSYGKQTKISSETNEDYTEKKVSSNKKLRRGSKKKKQTLEKTKEETMEEIKEKTEEETKEATKEETKEETREETKEETKEKTIEEMKDEIKGITIEIRTKKTKLKTKVETEETTTESIRKKQKKKAKKRHKTTKTPTKKEDSDSSSNYEEYTTTTYKPFARTRLVIKESHSKESFKESEPTKPFFKARPFFREDNDYFHNYVKPAKKLQATFNIRTT